MFGPAAGAVCFLVVVVACSMDAEIVVVVMKAAELMVLALAGSSLH